MPFRGDSTRYLSGEIGPGIVAIEFEVCQSVLVGQIHLDVTELVIFNSRIAHSE